MSPPKKSFNDASSAILVIVSRDRKIHVHREVLEKASPYFKTMLSGSSKKFHSTEIELKDDSPDAVFRMLKHVYDDAQPFDGTWWDNQHDIDGIVDLVHTADKYGLSSVVQHCLQVINYTLLVCQDEDPPASVFEALGRLPDHVLERYIAQIFWAMQPRLLLYTKKPSFSRLLDEKPELGKMLFYQLIKKGHEHDTAVRLGCTLCPVVWIGPDDGECIECGSKTRVLSQKEMVEDWEEPETAPVPAVHRPFWFE
ncbi:hypothetical protein BDZ85DRAFT_284254 [Elsinoe ampelina]|uniref:BTB domain-containing protein n=1 Tax=Elsinoe ampelina TaxID=302913 RepID=A0A6A6G4K4_9PEZI|nr:hypothetical protein BDZ85DRAFT_284254 [Elsinoe ampelina]